MQGIRPQAVLLLIGLFVVVGPAIAQVEDSPPISAASREYTLLAGYGLTHPGLGETQTRVQTVDLIGRFGYFLSDEIGKGWVRGRHQLFVELPLHLAIDPKTRLMTGGYLLGSWKFTGLKEEGLYPYVFAGGGVLYVDLGLPTMGSRLDFVYQGGAGIQLLVRNGMALMAEYRLHHISNAGTAAPNEPLNSSKVLFGISFFR